MKQTTTFQYNKTLHIAVNTRQTDPCSPDETDPSKMDSIWSAILG